MATLENLDHLGYVIKVKGRKLYVVTDCLPVNRLEAWSNDLANVVVYKTIKDAQRIKRAFDACKHNYNNISNFEIEIKLMHKKELMVAKLKGSKDD